MSSTKLVQLQFNDWPDRGVPESSIAFLSFLHVAMSTQRLACEEAKKTFEPKPPPIVVHCSAGVGRTGVFCLVYSSLTFLPFLGRPGVPEFFDILETVRRLRESRRYMVQTLDQYKFCYFTVAQAVRLFVAGQKQLGERQKTTPTPPPANQQLSNSVDLHQQSAIFGIYLLLFLFSSYFNWCFAVAVREQELLAQVAQLQQTNAGYNDIQLVLTRINAELNISKEVEAGLRTELAISKESLTSSVELLTSVQAKLIAAKTKITAKDVEIKVLRPHPSFIACSLAPFLTGPLPLLGAGKESRGGGRSNDDHGRF